MKKDGKVFSVILDANPQTRSVNIYNSGNKKVTLPESMGKKATVAKVLELKQDTELK